MANDNEENGGPCPNTKRRSIRPCVTPPSRRWAFYSVELLRSLLAVAKPGRYVRIDRRSQWTSSAWTLSAQRVS
jgi:hypothetical protein